jgi:hypothetical protein
MRNRIPEFIVDATNVYRTKDFIVKQMIGVLYDSEEQNIVLSRDTYYFRTRQRDSEYEAVYLNRKHIDGKRLPTMMYTRTYVY